MVVSMDNAALTLGAMIEEAKRKMSIQYVPNPEAEYFISVCFEKGVPGPDGWPDGYRWRMEAGGHVIADHSDLGGNPFLDVNHWLLPLTGYTRTEFLTHFFSSLPEGC